MQKWYPETFISEGSPTTAQAPQANFEGLAPSVEEASSSQSLGAQFRSESGFIDTAQLMNNLTRDERTQVFDLVEQDVREEYNVKNLGMADEYKKRFQQAQDIHDKSLLSYASEINRITEQELKKSSAAAARLAILLAEKIVRCQVGIDPDVLSRALETSMFKIQGSARVSVTVNPEEAEALNDNPELLKKLNIGSVESDRRIQSGGCLVKASDMEWDATVESQLSTLTEIVEEMISTSGSIPMPTVGVDPSEGGPSNEVD